MVKYIIGIDEVGRGSLAGPVTVAAAVVLKDLRFKVYDLGLPRLRDSKKLSPKQREEWFKYLKNHPQIIHTKASVSPKVIDRLNVSKAANLAATRALNKLTEDYKLQISNCRIFLDGGLYLLDESANSRTIIKGDEKIPVIALASIIAKVSRDRKMKRLHKKYPEYGFDEHKGYGTKKHIRAIKKHGLSSIHRRSFKIKD